MARAMVVSWRITKNAGTARQRFSSYEASAKKPRSGIWRIISPCNSLTFAPQRAQNLTNSSKSEAGRPHKLDLAEENIFQWSPPAETCPENHRPQATHQSRTTTDNGQRTTDKPSPSIRPPGRPPRHATHTRTHIGNSNKPLGGAPQTHTPQPPSF